MTVLFLCKLADLGCEVFILLNEILVGLIASYKNYILVQVTEANLCADRMAS